MNISIETITPEQARLMLDSNTYNRPVRKYIVDALARDMLRGNFKTTHQGIAVADDGKILDGQHRLSACVQSGVPITVVVARGMEKDLMYYVDTGLKRNYTDRAILVGKYDDEPVLRDPTTHGFVRRAILYGLNAHRQPTDAEIDMVIARYYKETVALARCAVKKGGSNAGINAGAFAALLCGESVTDVQKFYNIFLRGDSEGCFGLNTSAAFNFSRTILDARAKGYRIQEKKAYNLVQNAIYLFCRGGAPVKILRETKIERYPIKDKLKEILEVK